MSNNDNIILVNYTIHNCYTSTILYYISRQYQYDCRSFIIIEVLITKYKHWASRITHLCNIMRYGTEMNNATCGIFKYLNFVLVNTNYLWIYSWFVAYNIIKCTYNILLKNLRWIFTIIWTEYKLICYRTLHVIM